MTPVETIVNRRWFRAFRRVSPLRVDYEDAVKTLEVTLLAREASDKRAILPTTF